VGKGSRPNHGSYALYQGDSGLLVTAVVWGPGDHASPHDHGTWGMIGVMDNALTETRFRRVDDRTKEGFATLEKDRTSQFKPGEITLLIPEVDEIHQMDNFTGRPTVEIHVYGDDLRGLNRSRYNLETGEITPFATDKYDNC
jgi:predicted metal-dependent enzyme (double-stranded beta helix superfamily)